MLGAETLIYQRLNQQSSASSAIPAEIINCHGTISEWDNSINHSEVHHPPPVENYQHSTKDKSAEVSCVFYWLQCNNNIEPYLSALENYFHAFLKDSELSMTRRRDFNLHSIWCNSYYKYYWTIYFNWEY